jgi:chromosome segregation ATPase
MAKEKAGRGASMQAAPPQGVPRGEAKTAAPKDGAEQIEKLQKELRTIRAEKDKIEKRQATIEETLTRLFAEAAVDRKREKFLDGLTPAEIEVLKARGPA